MEKFSGVAFYKIATFLEKMSTIGMRNFTIDPHDITSEALESLNDACHTIGLNFSCKYLDLIIKTIDEGKTKSADFQRMLSVLHGRIKDEMEEKSFMYLPPERASRYDQQEPFGAEVHKNFPSVLFDSKEAGNCFASARFTACVFHLMRVLEVGLIAFAGLFPSVPTNKENWQPIIEKIESEIREMPKAAVKAPDWKEKQEKYSQIANNFMFFKDAWRNYTAHARGKYTEDESDAIYRNVRSFMQGLAKAGLVE